MLGKNEEFCPMGAFMKIITNNPRVLDKHCEHYDVHFVCIGYLDLLELVRDRIHKGARLLTHPLSGSVKPNETPYKSIVIEEGEDGVDFKSLMIIEDAIVMSRNLLKTPKLFLEDDKRMEDCRVIDLTLLDSALEK